MTVNIRVKGAVQGVGYRPFIAKKATEYGLKGFVRNIGAAVDILVIGEESAISDFTDMIKSEYPAGAFILSVEKSECQTGDFENVLKESGVLAETVRNDFVIIESGELDLSSELPVFLPDIGICDDCMSEMLDANNRRYRYPLISCASCGPRISILNKLPYDRDTTTMIDFDMCPQCASEYKSGRRRHAQTISCFDCGPQMELVRNHGDDDVQRAIELLLEDKIIGLKGMSGFQLVCRPTSEAATTLRQCKGRENKPFAVMFSDLDSIREYCICSDKEEQLLRSSARPIVLLQAIPGREFPYEVARDSRYIGAFLPSAGIHRLLTDDAGPLIVTSANISDEPIIIKDDDFVARFISVDEPLVSDVLTHKREINIPQDDSVMFVNKLSDGRDLALFNRRARGFVPLPIFTEEDNTSVLAMGGDLKNTFAFGKKDRIILSPYIGDLKDYGVNVNEKKLIEQFSEVFHFVPEKIVCDMHPLYESSAYGRNLSKKQNLPLFEVQHHHAHILSVMAEKSLKSCIGIAFDGTGYGTDGKIWGGEFLFCHQDKFERKGHLSYVKLCGGDNASKNAGQVMQCYEFAGKEFGDSALIPPIVAGALSNNIGTFETSSMGRLFDSVCSLLEIKSFNSFEGECAIALEKTAWEYLECVSPGPTPDLKCEMQKLDDCYIIDQIKLFEDIKKLYESKDFDKNAISFAFHRAIADASTRCADLIRQETGENKVCLSGGVFANRILLKLCFEMLLDKSFEVYTNELVPAGDSGISLGQAYFAALHDT